MPCLYTRATVATRKKFYLTLFFLRARRFCVLDPYRISKQWHSLCERHRLRTTTQRAWSEGLGHIVRKSRNVACVRCDDDYIIAPAG
jgi:hypothetical protein